jgi:hypothetical protein
MKNISKLFPIVSFHACFVKTNLPYFAILFAVPTSLNSLPEPTEFAIGEV